MASKTEYYDRIISSHQSDISSQKSEILDLKSTVAKQQREIDALKVSQAEQPKPSIPQQAGIDVEALLSEVKRVCDKAILTHYERLPTIFVDRQQFESFRKSAEQKFLSADAFTSYSKLFESRLKNLEGKLSRRFPLLTINRHTQKRYHDAKSYFNLDTIISILKSINLQWLIPIIVCLFICMLAVYLISSITT